jgi:hypothetical protein
MFAQPSAENKTILTVIKHSSNSDQNMEIGEKGIKI